MILLLSGLLFHDFMLYPVSTRLLKTKQIGNDDVLCQSYRKVEKDIIQANVNGYFT